MKKAIVVTAAALLALTLAACKNPLKKYALDGGDSDQKAATATESTVSGQTEASKTESLSDDALRAALMPKIEKRIGTKDPGTGDAYRFSLGDRVQDSVGKEYFYGRWMRVVYDLDSKQDVPSLMAEIFITPDGKELYVGSYSANSSGGSGAISFATGNLFDPSVNFNP